MSGKSKFRLLLMAALAGVCGYVGFLIFRERDPRIPYEAAAQAYRDGQMLEKRREFKAAADKFNLSAEILEHAWKRLNGLHGLDETELKELSGRVLFLKAMALRDKHYDLAEAAQKPLPDTKDSVTNTTYRNVQTIPDSKDRDEAMGAIRGAAIHFLPKDYDVQLEALRLELMTSPIAWDQVEKLSNQILDVKPEDSRAKYLLAKFHFEQPQAGRVQIAPENRSPERIKTSKRLIEEVKADPKFPIWRTEYLNAQIHFWMMNRHRNKRDREFFAELKELDELLMADGGGALPRIRMGEGLEHLGSWDTEAIVALHALAADISVETIRKRQLPDFSSLNRVFRMTLDFCKKKTDKEDPAFSRAMIISTLLNLMSKSQSFLATQSTTDWTDALNMLRPLLREEFKSERCDPYRVAQFAELLMREAHLQKRINAPGWEKLPDEAKAWLDEGLKYGNDHSLSNLQMAPFNMLAANILFFNTDKRENLTPYIERLELTKNHPQAQALALVLDGACDEREGRLDKARWKLERALRVEGAHGEEEVRANASLANIYMAMGMPDHAIQSLKRLRDVYDRFKDLSDLEKQWVGQFLRQPVDYYALIAIADMESARKTIETFRTKNPAAKTFPIALVHERQERVKTLLKSELPLIGPSPAGFMTRVAWINYLTATRQRELAEREHHELKKVFPDRLELLTLKVGLIQIQAMEAMEAGNQNYAEQLVRSIDLEIDAFIETHQKSPVALRAKLYKVLWLGQTKRHADAQKDLAKIGLEADKENQEFQRVFSTISLSRGTGASPFQLVQHIPHDPQIDKVLQTITANIEDQQAKIKSILTRFESVGISKVMQAEDLYAKGQYAEAANAFAGTLDFTRIKAMAQQGVIRSMFALAAKNADEALNLNMLLVKDFPKEPALHLCYAYIFLVRDEIGTPTSNWEQGHNMGSALNVWEQHMKDETSENNVMIALTQAEFWLKANRMDVARQRTQRALSFEPENPDVLARCIQSILDDPSFEADKELGGYLARLRRLTPENSPLIGFVNFMTARAEEYQGDREKALRIYHDMVSRHPQDRDAAVRLITLFETNRDFDNALAIARFWRKALPTDLQAVAAEIRLLSRKQQQKQAREVATAYYDESMKRVTELAGKIKDPDPAKQKKYYNEAIETVRNQADLEMANAFFLGGDLAEAEKRLLALPSDLRNETLPQELLGELYVKKQDWAKAEEIFEALHGRDRQNPVAANNLALVLSEHRNRPDRAREVIRAATKGNGVTTTRSADRFSPVFLATVGAVYMKLDSKQYADEFSKFYKSAYDRYPKDPRILLYWGYAHELKGEYARAEMLYQTAMKNFAHRGMNEEQRRLLARDHERSIARLRERARNVIP
jgi:predicted Zn-dependent protease